MDMIQYIGIPYEDRGRTTEGCDCYGFIRLVLLDMGIELPLYDYACQNPDSVAEELLAVKVDTPQDGDVVYLATREYSGHVGIYKGGQVWQMTHHGVISKSWKRIERQVMGIYRHQGDR